MRLEESVKKMNHIKVFFYLSKSFMTSQIYNCGKPFYIFLYKIMRRFEKGHQKSIFTYSYFQIQQYPIGIIFQLAAHV